MPTIAGEELNRRLCRDSQRSFHVVAAPPQAAPTQAVTKTPAMATTKSRALAIHRGDGRRHLPGRYRQQHHASKRSGNRRRPAARLSKTTRTTAVANRAAHRVSRTPIAASNSVATSLSTPDSGNQAGGKRKRASSSWHCNIKPALSISILNRNRMSLCLLTWPAVIGGPCRGSPGGRSSRGIYQ